jgi:hypothetical protein
LSDLFPFFNAVLNFLQVILLAWIGQRQAVIAAQSDEVRARVQRDLDHTEP